MADVDAKINFKISSNKMRVTAAYSPARGEGKRLSSKEVIDELKSLGVTTGIINETILKIYDSEKPMHSIIVADGYPPKVGEKAQLEMYVKLGGVSIATEKDDGSIDFRDLGEILSATKGQKLYRKIPPTIGEPGKNVFGEEIEGLLGRDLKIVLGPGTIIDEEDPNLVVASNDGEVLLKNGILQISDVHNIPGDVDYSTGNVKFKGTVKIGGSVKSGFEVIAEGSVEIVGNVEDAKVVSGCDVIIHGGCAGSGEGYVVAQRDVNVKFVENQHIEAKRDILINGESFHATLQAGRSLVAKGKKGAIVGGVCEVKTSLETDYLGSVACPPTVIKLGIDPKLIEKLKINDTETEELGLSLEKIEKSVLFLYRQKVDTPGGILSPEKQALLEKLEAAKKALPEKLEKLKADRIKLLKEQKELDKVFAVANNAVFPKVRVYIGNQHITVDDNLGPSRFQIIGSEVTRTSK
ncbi:DUF342 domain-containing protein [Candidatus Latescibacterota bacterium]